tara:strand:- start:121 stop:939 length:819 start_codon:yes stop_codon:yes gene_type:complete
MALETGTYISSLNASNPASTDGLAQADDHLRLIKSTLLSTLPNVTGAITATQAELNLMDGVTATTAELNLVDGLTATTDELNVLDGVTATTAELNYVDGVTSNLQTQLDTKITGVTAGNGLSGGGTSGAPTLTHADTSSQASVNNSGLTFIQDVTVDTYGHVTGLSSSAVSIPTPIAEAYTKYSGASPSMFAYNGISGVSRSAAGNTTYTFSNNEANTNYIVEISVQMVATVSDARNMFWVYDKSTTGFTVRIVNIHGSGIDTDHSVVVRRI